MRKAHWLKGNKVSQTINRVIWFDTETSQEQISEKTVEHHLEVGYAAFSRRISGRKWSRPQWIRFTRIDEFWEFVDSKVKDKTKLYLFCHNTNFDLPVLDAFTKLPELGFELKFAVIDAPPTILKFTKDKKSIVILDTLNFWRVPLKVLGESIGLEKLPMPDKDAGDFLWNEYCRRDTEIIMKAVQQWADFILRNDFGGFAYTVAGQAFRLYRHRYMWHKIGIHNNENACSIERLAYKGGRNECFRLGEIKGTHKLYDVNSMYPYVMLKEKYPTKLKYYSERKNIKDLIKLLKDYAVIATVILNTKTPAYCKKYHNKLIFPVGKFEITLCTPELIYAIEKGDIIEVKSLAVYQHDNIFKDYVEDIYTRRRQAIKEGNKVGKILYKLLLNSLYGKFGQKGIVYEKDSFNPELSTKVWTEIDLDEHTAVKWRALAGLVQKQVDEIESRDSFPAIAAHVTAYARMHLWSLIESQKGKCVYCDTDSLLIETGKSTETPGTMEVGEKLGQVKLEKTCHSGYIWGCKDYRLGGTDKHKGIKKTAFWQGQNSVYQEKWSSLVGQLRAGDLSKATTTKISKTLHRIYNKGYVLPGGLIKPFVFDLGEDPLPVEKVYSAFN